MGLPTNAVAENVLGTIGEQTVPPEDFGASIAIRIPQCFCALAAICWAQCLHYDQGRSTKFCFLAGGSAIALAGGLETALIFGAKVGTRLPFQRWVADEATGQAAENRGNGKVTEMAGIVSAILIAAGLVPQYWEIFKFRAVIGISLVFLVVDLSGGVFSVLSLGMRLPWRSYESTGCSLQFAFPVFAAGKFDTIASASYGVVVILEVGVFILAAILNPRHARKVAEAKRLDLEALGGAPSSASSTLAAEIELDAEKKGAKVKRPDMSEMRGRSREVVGMVWRSDASLERMERDGIEVAGVPRPDSAERKRQESVQRTFRS
ncbi:hypothetical protein P7C70_g1586, partial [Phenoliferia sp. Uapishka_3]